MGHSTIDVMDSSIAEMLLSKDVGNCTQINCPKTQSGADENRRKTDTADPMTNKCQEFKSIPLLLIPLFF